MSIAYIVCSHEPCKKLKDIGKPSLKIFVKESDNQCTLQASALQGLILSCRNFTRWFVR